MLIAGLRPIEAARFESGYSCPFVSKRPPPMELPLWVDAERDKVQRRPKLVGGEGSSGSDLAPRRAKARVGLRRRHRRHGTRRACCWWLSGRPSRPLY